MEFPMPNDPFLGGIVIASKWMADDEDNQLIHVLSMNMEAPFYSWWEIHNGKLTILGIYKNIAECVTSSNWREW